MSIGKLPPRTPDTASTTATGQAAPAAAVTSLEQARAAQPAFVRNMTATQHAELNRFLSTNDRAGATRYLISIGEPMATFAASRDKRSGISFADVVGNAHANYLS